MTSFVFI